MPKKIINTFIKNANIMRAVALATYKEWAAYRSHVLVSLFVGPVYFLVQVFIWKAVYAARGTVNGLTLEQMITYFGVSVLMNYLIMDFADWNLQMLVHTGKFLTYMLRPMSHVYFALSQKVGHRLLGFAIEFIPVYLIFFLIFRISLIPASPVYAAISIILGFLMMFLVDYCIGITAFWLTRTSGVRRMFLVLRNICSGVFLPLVFYPMPVQKVLFFLPFQFIAYVPARVCIGSYELGGITVQIPRIVGIQAIAVMVMSLLTVGFFKLGIRKFTGVGT
ncbi:MAG: ABC transporter permease [Bacillota bacterium]